jgi:hypothetical protein
MEMAPQSIEKIESGLEKGASPSLAQEIGGTRNTDKKERRTARRKQAKPWDKPGPCS